MSRQHANGNSILLPEPGESLLLTFNLLTLRVAQVLERSVRQEAGAQLSAINVGTGTSNFAAMLWKS